MFVLTVDQVASRRRPDLVDQALTSLADVAAAVPFTRTLGDEFQGAVQEESSVLAAILILMRSRQWHLGLGIGPVERPLPTDSRSARGPAFVAARSAVEQAKREPSHLAVVSAAPTATEAEDAAVVLRLLLAAHERRSAQGWEAVDAMRAATSQAEVATALGISRQAVGQRLRAAAWALEEQTLPVLTRLLGRADDAATTPAVTR
ncbi:SatD family protein [uncultured Friedmanniella sp.]|uniref:SatD family protein n=1 Tax=uncultured Friedmanniella sp. TaxID=335381 RepID=UPI0035C9581F